MEILNRIDDLKFIKINSLTRDSIFIGTYSDSTMKDISGPRNPSGLLESQSTSKGLDDTVIIAIKTVPLTDTSIIKKMLDSKNTKKIFDNNRFKKYMCELENEYEVTVLYPALNEDINKYIPVTKKIVFETPEMYMEKIYPKAISQDLSWIHNIFEGKAEREDILYEDDGFVLMPDMKWIKRSAKRSSECAQQNANSKKLEVKCSAKTKFKQDANSDTDYNNMYCLAIVKDGSLKSIRDLRQEHIPLLNNIYENGTRTIKELYGIDKDQVRVYFHYRPTFWHLHVHFNLISNIEEGSNIDISHRLQTVITNLELKSNYYEMATLEVIELKK